MNKIKVVNNVIIPFDNSDVIIDGKIITFIKNGNYYIEYIDSDNIDIEIEVKDNVCISLFEFANGNKMVSHIKYNLHKKTSLILSKFYNSYDTEENIDIYLNEEKANINYNFSSIGNGCNKYLFNVYHLNKNTTSNIFNRVVARKNSANYFDINSYVDNGIIDCYLKQETKIITIGDSLNRINPNMFIGENSTTAIHSSVIGSVDNDSLFYLMSRGIDYRTSISLIIKGMILANINPDMKTKEIILKILDTLGGD